MTTHTTPEGVEVRGALEPPQVALLSPDALAFVAALHRQFNPQRVALLQARQARQARLDAGERPTQPEATGELRESDWQVAPIPEPLQRRHVEITGPVDRKMVINALNSGADVFMADFEDASSPTWANMIDGQVNLRDAARRTLTYEHPKRGTYTLNESTAVLLVRPRGWHLEERHLLIDGQPASASLVDFGLYFFHNARALVERGLGPYFYLPKLESHHEAKLWDDVFRAAQDALSLPVGTIKATVLLENILLSFEVDEVLWALREHMAGINAGRWDYIFSAIKKFRQHAPLFPDRGQITMGAPFMRAYTTRLVQRCHARGAHAIGGMAAFIPSRDPEINRAAFDKVRADKEREARDGFDGTWVAHPGLVEVAREAFDAVLKGRPHQKEVLREDEPVSDEDLLNFAIEAGKITEQGLRQNIHVGVRYIASWLGGVGAAAIHNLMEDAATAEISRSQVWQWLHRGAKLDDGRPINRALIDAITAQECDALSRTLGSETPEGPHLDAARALFIEVATSPDFTDFLTLAAYPRL